MFLNKYKSLCDEIKVNSSNQEVDVKGAIKSIKPLLYSESTRLATRRDLHAFYR